MKPDIRHLVLGNGQIGAALVRLFDADWVDLKERKLSSGSPYSYLHVCIPHSSTFDRDVRNARAALAPMAHTVIHSTVPIGTSIALDATHSPMRGTHPDLHASLWHFVKYFGGPEAPRAAQPFMDLGIRCTWHTSSKTTEALKLLDTLQYGVQIRLMQHIHAFCERYGHDFNTVYRDANETYNAGYVSVGKPQVVRPSLEYKGDDIGGHCVMPNLDLLFDLPALVAFVRSPPELLQGFEDPDLDRATRDVVGAA